MLLGTILLFTVPLFFKFDIQHSDRKPNIFIKVLNSVKHMGMVIKGYILDFKMFVYVMIISLFFQALMNVINALIGYSLHLNVPLSYYFIAVPLITLCTAVPISLSGFGIREGSYIYFLRFVGVTPAEGVLLSLTSVFVTAITSATGGILLFREGFLIQREKPSEDETDANSET